MAEGKEKVMDFRPLAHKLNVWLSGEGRTILQEKLGESGQIELLSFREGGYRRTYLLTGKGLVEDFYPVVLPTHKGEGVTVISDTLNFIAAMDEEGDYHTPEEIEKAFWEKVGIA
jgi:hypothetical protein